MATPYSNRELDEKFKALGDKVENVQNVLELKMTDGHKTTTDSLSRIEIGQEATNKKLDFTNGKVRKITIALVLLFGVCIGLGFTEAKIFLPLLGL